MEIFRNKNLRFFVYLVVFSFLFYSCSIYNTAPISLSEARDKGKKVKITTTNEKYIFKGIVGSNGEYYGLVRKNNSTFKKLVKAGVIGRESGNLYSFNLEKLDIQKIQAKNYPISTIATVAVSIIGLLAIISILALGAWNGSVVDLSY